MGGSTLPGPAGATRSTSAAGSYCFEMLSPAPGHPGRRGCPRPLHHVRLRRGLGAAPTLLRAPSEPPPSPLSVRVALEKEAFRPLLAPRWNRRGMGAAGAAGAGPGRGNKGGLLVSGRQDTGGGKKSMFAK